MLRDDIYCVLVCLGSMELGGSISRVEEFRTEDGVLWHIYEGIYEEGSKDLGLLMMYVEELFPKDDYVCIWRSFDGVIRVLGRAFLGSRIRIEFDLGEGVRRYRRILPCCREEFGKEAKKC